MHGLLSPFLLGGKPQTMQQPGGLLAMAGNGYPMGGAFPPGGNLASQQTPQNGFGQRLKSMLDPANALPVAAAMMGSGGNMANFGNAMQAAGGVMQRNKTLSFLKKNHPELAGMVEAGIPLGDAFDMALAERKLKAQAPEFDEMGFPRSGAMSQKIKALEMQGFDRQQALGIASGRFDVSINPTTGERVMIDVAEQRMIPLQGPEQRGGEQVAGDYTPGNGSGRSLYDMSGDATGVASSVQRGLSNTIGQVPGPIGDMVTFPEAIEAGQEYELFKRDLIRSLSLNTRFPVAEMQRIEGLVPTGPLTSSDTTRTSLQSLDRELARIEQVAAAGANDPNAPIEQRQADQQTIRSVQQARQRIGLSGQGGQGAGPRRTSTGVQWSVD